jgi:arylsulfatase A-like enzyme
VSNEARMLYGSLSIKPTEMKVMKTLVLLFLLLITTFGAGADQPNVVFILADDLGWTDLACYGSGYYETPNIDRLATQGIRFTSAYSCGPNCQPTRAALLSGQYMPTNGVYRVGSRDESPWNLQLLEPPETLLFLGTEKISYGKAVKSAGFVTSYFGKWHLGVGMDQFHPLHHGFDEAIISGGSLHFNFVTYPAVAYTAGTYSADFFTDQALRFIEGNRSNKFCLTVSYIEPHAPYQAPQRLIDQFVGKAPAGGHTNPVYAAMIASIDENVGRILQKLDDLGLTNTIVIFTSDNGGVIPATSNDPLRSGKGSLYEGGIRVPLIVRWPGMIATNRVTDTVVNSVDLYATILDATGSSVPQEYPIDGISFLNTLTNETSGSTSRHIFWHYPGYSGPESSYTTSPVSSVRNGEFVLLKFWEDNHVELYNLQADLSETNNLASEFPELAITMEAILTNWLAETHAPMPRLNGAYPPIITVEPKGLSVNEGQGATFVVALSGSGPMSYQWVFNGTNIAGATNSSYSKQNPVKANIGEYFVVASNAYGTVVSTNVYLSVIGRWISSTGAYNGLFYEASGVRIESAGFVSISLSEWGRASGRVVLRGVTNTFGFSIGTNGSGEGVIIRTNENSLSIRLNFIKGSDTVTGTISDGVWVSDVIADRALMTSGVNLYTFEMGSGYGLLTVTNGLVKLTGGMIDGTSLIQNVQQSTAGDWPLYTSLYNGTGLLMGWLRIATSITGAVAWVKTNEANLTVGGMSYSPLGSQFTAGTICYTDSTLTNATVFTSVNTNGNGIFPAPNTNKWKVRFFPSTGSFTGSLVINGVTNDFKGAIIQSPIPKGVGFLTGTNAAKVATITISL